MAGKSIAERKAALEAEMKKLEEEEKQQELAKSEIIGRVVSAEMLDNPTVQQQVTELLQVRLVKNKERELFGFDKIASKRGRPSGGISSGG